MPSYKLEYKNNNIVCIVKYRYATKGKWTSIKRNKNLKK